MLFEYEKENNKLKDTLEKAIERKSSLRNASLRSANLRGADLRGAYIDMWDVGDPNINEIITELENNSNLKIKKYYINKHILPPFCSTYWENGLIIDEYEIVEPKVKEMTISEISKALGYEVKVVKEHE